MVPCSPRSLSSPTGVAGQMPRSLKKAPCLPLPCPFLRPPLLHCLSTERKRESRSSPWVPGGLGLGPSVLCAPQQRLWGPPSGTRVTHTEQIMSSGDKGPRVKGRSAASPRAGARAHGARRGRVTDSFPGILAPPHQPRRPRRPRLHVRSLKCAFCSYNRRPLEA